MALVHSTAAPASPGPGGRIDCGNGLRVVSSGHAGAAVRALVGPGASGSAIVVGNAGAVLKELPGAVFQTCVTSPPYWSLRDYHIAGQIGLEPSLTAYLASLIAVFAEVRRLLREDGTLWLNIGDSYTSGGRTYRAIDQKNPS